MIVYLLKFILLNVFLSTSITDGGMNSYYDISGCWRVDSRYNMVTDRQINNIDGISGYYLKFYDDGSVEISSGIFKYYKNIDEGFPWQYLGTKTKYKYQDAHLYLWNPILKKWNKYSVLKGRKGLIIDHGVGPKITMRKVNRNYLCEYKDCKIEYIDVKVADFERYMVWYKLSINRDSVRYYDITPDKGKVLELERETPKEYFKNYINRLCLVDIDDQSNKNDSTYVSVNKNIEIEIGYRDGRTKNYKMNEFNIGEELKMVMIPIMYIYDVI